VLIPDNTVPSERPDQSVGVTQQSARLRAPTSVVSAARRKVKSEGEIADEKLIEQARERFRNVVDSENAWRRRATEELKFVDGLEHWTTEMKEERKGLPCLTFDLIGPPVDQVVNDARQSPPEPRVSPVGGGADKDTAEVLQGLIRNIDEDSNGETCFLTGYEHAVKIGRGWWRVHFEYEGDHPTHQKIVILRVPNPFSVYPDPATDKFDYSDMRYCFVTEDIDKDLFEELYPDAAGAGLCDFTSLGDKVKEDWFPSGAIRVAEYWWVEQQRYTSCQLQDGTVVPLDLAPEGAVVVASRECDRPIVKGAKITGKGIIERWDWPGKWIPLIPCIGKEVLASPERQEIKRSMRGMIRAAMDANLSYDFARSKEAQAISLAPVSQWIVAEGQIESYQNIWADANRKPVNALIYKRYRELDGKDLGVPQRVNAEANVAAISQAIATSQNDVRNMLSSWQEDRGNPQPDQSGRAILALQQRGDNAHYNYRGNLGRSIRHTGEIIVDLCPHVYSEDRLVNIDDPDGSRRLVRVNAVHIEKGVQRIYALGNKLARYNVTVSSAPSYASRRLAGQAALLDVAKIVPAIQQRAPDLLVQALDIPDGDKFADRLRPPGVQAEQDGQQPIPVDVQQKMTQMGGMIDLLTQELNKATEIIRTKRIEMESQERRTAMTVEGNMIAAALKAKSAEAQTLVVAETDAIRHRLDLLHDHLPLLADDLETTSDAPGPGAQPASPAAPPAAPAGAPSPNQPGPA